MNIFCVHIMCEIVLPNNTAEDGPGHISRYLMKEQMTISSKITLPPFVLALLGFYNKIL